MKKIVLINSNTEVLPYPVAPLGLALLASSLKDEYHVKVIDFAFSSTEKMLESIQEFRPDFIGISIRNIDNVTMNKSKWYLQEIKDSITNPIKKQFKVPLIIGGSGFSIAPKQLLDFFNADYGVVGEGEIIFPRLLKAIEKGSKMDSISGIISRRNKLLEIENYGKGELQIPRANIDHHINFEHYQRRGNYPVQTKRGCTHKCIYCSYPKIEGNTYRLRSVSDIVDEIEEVNNSLPSISIEFVDSTFNSPLKHAIQICQEIIKRNIVVNLRTMGVNPGEVTEELILLMKKAGFSQIDCTPDSASEKMIKKYRKNFNKEGLKECAKIIRNQDMPTMWFFMMGAPGETEETIMETFAFIDEFISSEDMVHITEGIRIIPNTELYTIAIHQGVISEKDSVIEPMYYVDPKLGHRNLTTILKREIAKRNNVLNSIDTAPSPELMQAALNYRTEYKIDEPMFRTLLKIQNQIFVK